jgi:shikimate kinase
MNQTGKTIYLNIDPDILAERLIKSKSDRPLIRGKSKKELIEFINTSLEKRNKFYKQAQFQITQPDTGLNDIMEMIS